MALAAIRLELQSSDLESLRLQLTRLFDAPNRAAILKAALEKALAPALAQLQSLTPIGPTGNLRSAAAIKVVAYTRDGNAVGLLGYRRAGRSASRAAAGGKVRVGPDRAFHQFWLEEGTQERTITTIANKPYRRKSHRRRTRFGTVTTVRDHIVAKGQNAVIASSYRKLGPFTVAPTSRKAAGVRVQTEPAYPAAFFRKARKGQPIRIEAMPAGGRSGQPPLKTAWERTQGTVAAILQQEIGMSIEKALQSLTYSAEGNL